MSRVRGLKLRKSVTKNVHFLGCDLCALPPSWYLETVGPAETDTQKKNIKYILMKSLMQIKNKTLKVSSTQKTHKAN